MPSGGSQQPVTPSNARTCGRAQAHGQEPHQPLPCRTCIGANADQHIHVGPPAPQRPVCAPVERPAHNKLQPQDARGAGRMSKQTILQPHWQ